VLTKKNTGVERIRRKLRKGEQVNQKRKLCSRAQDVEEANTSKKELHKKGHLKGGEFEKGRPPREMSLGGGGGGENALVERA